MYVCVYINLLPVHVRTSTVYSIFRLVFKHSAREYCINIEMKLTSIDFSRQVAGGSRTSYGCKPWVTNLSIVPHTLDTLTSNITCCILLHVYEVNTLSRK